MEDERLRAELMRLVNIRSDARCSESLGGFSSAARLEYEERKSRIYDLRNAIADGRTEDAKEPYVSARVETLYSVQTQD
jgi:hypothetical protein